MKDFLEWLAKDGGDTVRTFLAVWTKRSRAFDGLDLRSQSTLQFALRFFFYVIVIDVVLMLLGERIFSGTVDASKTMLLLRFAVIAIEWIVYIAILHVCMKLFGGTASAQESICVFCFLSAFFPVLALLEILPGRIVIPATRGHDSFSQETVAKMINLFQHQTLADQVRGVLLGLAIAVVAWVFVESLFKALKNIHNLDRIKAIKALAISLAVALLYMWVIQDSFLGSLNQPTKPGPDKQVTTDES